MVDKLISLAKDPQTRHAIGRGLVAAGAALGQVGHLLEKS